MLCVSSLQHLPDGGCWCYRLARDAAAGTSKLESEANRLWERLILSLVGETIDEPSVVGAIVCVRAEEIVRVLPETFEPPQATRDALSLIARSLMRLDAVAVTGLHRVVQGGGRCGHDWAHGVHAA